MNATKTVRSTTQALLAAVVAISTLLAPLAAIAQEPLPGGTVPAADTTVTDAAATDALSVDALGAIPAGPAAYSGGAIAADEVLETETLAEGEVLGYGTDEYPLETYVLYGSEEAAAAGPLTEEGTAMKTYIANVQWEHNPHAMPLLGYGAGSRNILSFPDIRALNAGWYVDWRVQVNPPRPTVQYVQMIRVHQKLDETKVYNPNTGQMCANGLTADRTICPYASPAAYEYSPSAAVIQQAAKKNPGSLWLIGNEMERPDWNGGRQDEIVPEMYTWAFSELRGIIKAADPTAKIGIGGVIQFTPLRAEWLNRVWTHYKQITGVSIDSHIDVFNIHNFIGSERCDLMPNPAINNRMERFCSGMGIPAGVTGTRVGNTWMGSYVGQDNRHLDQPTANEQITNFRAWLKSKNAGNVNKPLIISEYGVLYSELCTERNGQDKVSLVAENGVWKWNNVPNGVDDKLEECQHHYLTDTKYGAKEWGWVDMTNPKIVQDYMIGSFNAYNSTLKDCNLSGAANDCMLVQRWAWFGLEDIGWNFNTHGALLNLSTGRMTQTGKLFAQWAKSH